MPSIKQNYALIAGIFMLMSILLFCSYALETDNELSISFIFIFVSILIAAAYYFVLFQKERLTLLIDNKELQLNTIKNEKCIEEKLQRLELEREKVKKFSMIIEQSHDAIMVTDAEGTIEYVNKKFTEMTGYQIFELLGRNSRVVQPEWVKPGKEKEFLSILGKGSTWRSEVTYRKKNSDTYWAFESVSFLKDENGQVTHYLSTHRDVSQEHELSKQLSFQATHDALTGLSNRRAFEKRIEELLSSRTKKTEHAVCFIDLDQFKVVNDTCGHIAGDELLRQLSTLLQNTIRNRDTLARLGGDEFGIIFEYCPIDNAYRVTSSILDAVQNFQFSWEEKTFKLGASIGLVAMKDTMRNMTDLLKAADAACYMAKDSGRNRIQIYHAEDSNMVQRQGEMQWVTRINEALDEDLFCLYAQVIEPIHEKTEKHYELLIRMSDKKGGLIPPGAFLPAAERYNLISKLDRWVINHALEMLANNIEFQSKINFFSINLSGQSITEEDFLEFVVECIEKSGINNGKICFEITETAAISNLNVAVNFISTLKEMGCVFALDDFGSGLSSFGYLKNLPVDYLKIDGMFVKDIVEDPIDRAMVKSINEIGQVMGMKTIAEFVENNQIKQMLADLGVDYAQGYGIGKPVPLCELLDEKSSFDIASNY